MTNIYYIFPIENYKNRMDINTFNYFTYLKNNSKHNIVFIEKDNNSLLLKKNIKKNDIIICYGIKQNLSEQLKTFNNIKIIDVEDIKCICNYKCHGKNKTCRFNKVVNETQYNIFDYYLYRYKTYITVNASLKNKSFFYPHYIDSNMFYNMNLDKKYDILLYGYDDITVYPFRNRLFKLLQKNNDKFNIKKLDFPGWGSRAKKKGIVGKELSKLINESWITIATKSLNNLLLKKYIEISMSNSVICGDYPDLETNYWKNNMIYIDHNMKDNEIIEIIKSNLNNKQKLKTMANNACNISHSKFTYKNGLVHFENIIDNILNK